MGWVILPTVGTPTSFAGNTASFTFIILLPERHLTSTTVKESAVFTRIGTFLDLWISYKGDFGL